MFQGDAELPQVPRVPAPWVLHGRAWVVLLRLPAAAAARYDYVPAALRASVAAPLSALMYVDYAVAPCGPYRELLFVPGVMRFPDGRRHASISRILVSTWDSVVNGRANWGIPKDRADFVLDATADRERITVSADEREICRLEFSWPRGPRLPLATRWLPRHATTLAQHDGERLFYYRPEARGTFRFGRLRSWRFGPNAFPDLTTSRVVTALHVDQFAMTFPAACIVTA